MHLIVEVCHVDLSFPKHLPFAAIILTAFLSLLPLWTSAQIPVDSQQRTPFSETAVRQRTDNLLKQMTPEEKIGQLSVIFALGSPASFEKRLKAGELGSVLFVTDPARINTMQRMAVEESRLHIPLLFGLDVLHGFKTIFPVPIGMASSWDPALMENAQSIAAEEARSVGIHWMYGPMLDIARDPRWGRIVEGAGEDPYLGSAMGTAQVRGFQGPYIGAPNHLVACAKHFAGYGAAEGGRDYDGVDISDDQLWNVYLPPFKSAVQAGVGTVMSAYMDLNGVPATGNKWLLRDVLREQWHFRGFVVSDNDAVKDLKIHGFAKDSRDAALRAFDVGVNMEMSLGKTEYGANLPQAFRQHQITERQLDDAVRPILETKIRLGLFEHPYVDETKARQTIDDPAHRAVALHMAEKSAVLLRNEGALLPLQASRYKSIAVLGPLADSKADTVGSWVFANDQDETVTLLESLRLQAGTTSNVEFAPGGR